MDAHGDCFSEARSGFHAEVLDCAPRVSVYISNRADHCSVLPSRRRPFGRSTTRGDRRQFFSRTVDGAVDQEVMTRLGRFIPEDVEERRGQGQYQRRSGGGCDVLTRVEQSVEHFVEQARKTPVFSTLAGAGCGRSSARTILHGKFPANRENNREYRATVTEPLR